MRNLFHFFFLLVLCILVHPVAAQERLALVIGNQAYEHSRKLVNPVNDAIAIRGRLQEAGFDVTLLQDANHEIFERTLKDFSLRLKPESVAVVYFAGHGMQTGGVTYLLPVDADADAAESLKYEAVALDLVLDLLDRGGQGAGLKFVILDCCRNDPFGRGWRGDRDAAGETGLAAPSSTPSGTVLCYATDPGKVASDGRGVNSPYTDGLVKHLFTPGLDFDLALRRVGAEVQSATGSKQNPWRNANFNGSFAFVPGTVQPATMARPTLVPAAADRGMEGSRAGEVREFGGIEMVWCPPGEFLMGSQWEEAPNFDGETQHRVTLTRGFWMAKTEATQGQWERVTGDNPSESKGNDLPVESVSWDDVQGWLEKKNERAPLPSGWKWALPTEAQWEYACRAGTETPYAGTGELNEMGWYDDNSGSTIKSVATKKANDWGFYDMHGNVREWCADWYGDYPSGSSTDPTGSSLGDQRVARGGSRYEYELMCRAACRHSALPSSRGEGFLGFLYSQGFRPALVPSIQ